MLERRGRGGGRGGAVGILPHRYLNLHLSGLRTPDEVVTREGDGGGVGGGCQAVQVTRGVQRQVGRR